MLGEVKVEEVLVRVFNVWHSHNHGTEHSVTALQSRVRMPEVRPCCVRCESE